jgi:hypothetical protein
MISLFVLVALLLGCTHAGQTRPSNMEQDQVASIVAALKTDKVSRIEILQIPSRILYRTRVTSAVLEKDYYLKLTIRYFHDSDQFARLVASLDSTRVELQSNPADLRWGLIFYSKDDSRIGAFFFDQTGSRGAVNGTPVSIDGTLFKWVGDTFSNCFR